MGEIVTTFGRRFFAGVGGCLRTALFLTVLIYFTEIWIPGISRLPEDCFS